MTYDYVMTDLIAVQCAQSTVAYGGGPIEHGCHLQSPLQARFIYSDLFDSDETKNIKAHPNHEWTHGLRGARSIPTHNSNGGTNTYFNLHFNQRVIIVQSILI